MPVILPIVLPKYLSDNLLVVKRFLEIRKRFCLPFCRYFCRFRLAGPEGIRRSDQHPTRLGVKFTTTVAGLPWLRGKVERVFRSIDDKFVAMFAGRTFGNAVAKGEYDSEGNACLTIDEFAEALARYKGSAARRPARAGST